jgi:aminoglycoside phosphotransferase
VALVSAASKARNGLPCTVPALTRNSDGKLDLALIQSQMGGQNCHVDIAFEDGTVWLARIRLNDPLHPPQPTQMHIFTSEVATLRFLEQTAVPAPRVYTFAADSGANLVGASYVLMEKLPGAPLRWDTATSGQRRKVMGQLADIFLELEKCPLPLSGSLCLSHDVPVVGGFAQPGLFSSPKQTLGPFETVESSLRAMILQQQDQIVHGELSSLAVDNYLSHY